MKTIIPASTLATQVLGKQKRREGVTYRLFKYVAQEPVEDGLLLYNSMTLELLLLSPEEAEEMMESEELLAKWFLVPEGHDDRKLADDLRAFAKAMSKPLKYITFYKIFTTTHCNARCYYCYEQHVRNKKTMTRETAEQLVKYIAEHCGGNKVKLEWFGGEPLVNPEAIDIVCQGLADAGVPFHSVMVSNGYLFDEAVIQKAKGLWRMEKVQINMDGTEETYNRSKAYVNPQGSPYRRVLDNVNALLDAGIRVNITSNISEENWQDAMRLADQLAERFGGREEFVAYVGVLGDSDSFQPGQPDAKLPWNDDRFKKYKEVQEHLVQLGFPRRESLARNIHINACMADHDGAVTVLPDGSLGFCPCFAEGETFGSIHSADRDSAMIDSWKEYLPLTDSVCSDCLNYPQCVLLKKCPNGHVCTVPEREYREKDIHLQMLDEYRNDTERRGTEAP
ncbi:MAG: radical SAM protein [Ruminococcus sp.]|nr:radical SAM protein [Ruminococcus sp.]